MQFEAEVDGRVRRVAVHRQAAGFAIELDGRTWHIDAVRIDPHTLSLIVATAPRSSHTGEGPDNAAAHGGSAGGAVDAGGRSFEVMVAADSAGQLDVRVGPALFAVTLDSGRRRNDQDLQSGDGPQRIVAPMPGKVVRMLVTVGDAVVARQGLVVVEAMKMENELRAKRAGTVTQIHVNEGASVEAGALLVDIR